MFILYTDFGNRGPYTGQMKIVLMQHAPTVPAIDLMHDAPRGNPKAAAYLLASIIAKLPENVVVIGVVDPGVGDVNRRPIVLQADGRCFVGPDNGLFEIVARRALVRDWWEIIWRPEKLSSSFHGRDLFAPVAAKIASVGVSWSGIQPTKPGQYTDWPDELAEIVYIDFFGNAITGLRADFLSVDKKVAVHEKTISFAPTFSAVPQGQEFWYENSSGLVELAVNFGRADDHLHLSIGDSIQVLENA